MEQNNHLIHYASEYYDPAKAHEYYMKNRQLKGRRRTTTVLTDEGKEVWATTKANINEEKKAELEQIKVDKEQKIATFRANAQVKREEISGKLKQLSEILNNKYKNDTQNLTDSQKNAIASIKRQREAERKAVIKQKQKDLEDAREEYEVPKDADADERAKINKKRARALSSINEKAKNDLSTINNKYNTQSENVRKNTANQRQALRENKKTEMASNSETAKKERAEVASNLKATITMAKEQYQSRKEEIINKYEGIYDNEYDNIKSEYYKPSKKGSKYDDIPTYSSLKYFKGNNSSSIKSRKSSGQSRASLIKQK